MDEALLDLRGLTVSFAKKQYGSPQNAIVDVGFSISEGEIVGIVGESGSGKTVTARAVAGLLQYGAKVEGEIGYRGAAIGRLRGKKARQARKGISYIFQDPTKALDPVFTIGSQLTETLRQQRGLSAREAKAVAVELLVSVGIPEPQRRMKEHPHALSGGMAQRVMTALALACSPRLLIADEPTSALDVSIQAQILALLRHIRDETGTGIIFISHSLGAVAELCDRIVVMYSGRVIEIGPTAKIIRDPRHPYTVGLLNSVPQLRADAPRDDEVPFQGIPAAKEAMSTSSVGCNFANRCRFALPKCTEIPTTMIEVESGRLTRCIRADELFAVGVSGE